MHIYTYASECVETPLVLAWESSANTHVDTESRYPAVPAVSHPSFAVGQLFSFCGRSAAWKYLSTLKLNMCKWVSVTPGQQRQRQWLTTCPLFPGCKLRFTRPWRPVTFFIASHFGTWVCRIMIYSRLCWNRSSEPRDSFWRWISLLQDLSLQYVRHMQVMRAFSYSLSITLLASWLLCLDLIWSTKQFLVIHFGEDGWS